MAGGPRVLFLGMTGAFSLPPLDALLAAGIDVCAVLVPASERSREDPRRVLPPAPSSGPLSVLTPFVQPSIVSRAWAADCPVYEVTNLTAADDLASMQPDVIAVACFPRLIPAGFRALARRGAVNVHPSLLPDNRGPDPLFWTFRLGQRQTGVTVHLLTDKADAGDMVAQAPLEVPDGIAGPELERRCAELGAQLLVQAVRDLAAGSTHPRRQDEVGATYHQAPSASDYVICTDRPARWAFNFVRGVRARGGPLRIAVSGGEGVPIRDALSYDDSGRLTALSVRHPDGSASFQFQPGVLTAAL